MADVVATVIGVVLLACALALFLPVSRIARASRVEERNREMAQSRAAGAEASGKQGKSWADVRLEAAGVKVPAGYFAVVVAAVLAACAFGGYLLKGPLGAVCALVVALAAIVLVLASRASKRKGLFEQQLGECLPMVAEGIRGGMTFERSIRNVADFMEDPIREQFKTLAVERSYGTPLPDAVAHMADRVNSRDMDMLASVVAVQAETGGSMADILDTIAETIQRRNRLRKHVSAVTADGRLSAAIIGAIPVVILVVLVVVAPDYAGVLVTTPAGWAMLAVSAALIAVGLLFIRKLYNIKIY